MSGGELDTDTEEEDDLAEEYACKLVQAGSIWEKQGKLSWWK